MMYVLIEPLLSELLHKQHYNGNHTKQDVWSSNLATIV